MACSRDGIYNSMLLEVVSVDSNTITLRDTEGGGVFPLSHDWVRRHTRSALAYTIASAQGRTIPGSISLYDTRHPRYTRRHLYTSLSRARNYDDLTIED